ncbi:MAG: hypothetical protein IPJ36_11825 [Simplicispira sp.]|nr:hypothetical protein [Simplicispira sp.]
MSAHASSRPRVFTAAPNPTKRAVRSMAQAQQRSARAQVQANADTGTDIAQAQAQLDVARAARGLPVRAWRRPSCWRPRRRACWCERWNRGRSQPGKAFAQPRRFAGPTQLVAQVDAAF